MTNRHPKSPSPSGQGTPTTKPRNPSPAAGPSTTPASTSDEPASPIHGEEYLRDAFGGRVWNGPPKKAHAPWVPPRALPERVNAFTSPTRQDYNNMFFQLKNNTLRSTKAPESSADGKPSAKSDDNSSQPPGTPKARDGSADDKVSGNNAVNGGQGPPTNNALGGTKGADAGGNGDAKSGQGVQKPKVPKEKDDKANKRDQERLSPTAASSHVITTVPTGLTDNDKSSKEKLPEKNPDETKDLNGSGSNMPNGRSTPTGLAHDSDDSKSEKGGGSSKFAPNLRRTGRKLTVASEYDAPPQAGLGQPLPDPKPVQDVDLSHWVKYEVVLDAKSCIIPLDRVRGETFRQEILNALGTGTTGGSRWSRMLGHNRGEEMINILSITEKHMDALWWRRFYLHILPNVYVNIASLRPLAWEENPVTKFMRLKYRINDFTALFMNPAMTRPGRSKVFGYHGTGSTIAKDIRAAGLGVALSEQMIIDAFYSVLPEPKKFSMMLVMYDRLNAMKDLLVAHLMSDNSHRNLTNIWTPIDHLIIRLDGIFFQTMLYYNRKHNVRPGDTEEDWNLQWSGMATGLIYGAPIAVITEMRDERNDRNDKLIAGIDAAGAVATGVLGGATGTLHPAAGAAVTGVAGGVGALATTAISNRLARKSANMTELIDRVLCKFNTEVLRRAELGYMGTNWVLLDPTVLKTKNAVELYKSSAVNVLTLVSRQEGVYLDDVARTANSLPLKFKDPVLLSSDQLLHQEPQSI